MGAASFIPHSLKPSPDAACYSILGFDPLEFYTGPGPLEALALGLEQNDRSIAFRCNFVTVFDNTLVDPCAGEISNKEALFLLTDLNEQLSSEKIKLFANRGYKNILIVDDADLTDSLKTWEWAPPKNLAGQKMDKVFSKNTAGDFLTGLIDRSHALLDSHEINRVRVDLKENPANMIWLWGQGKKPKLPSFAQATGHEAVAVCNADFAKGLAKALGMRSTENLDQALGNEFVFVYQGLTDSFDKYANLKTRIKCIEEFDALLVSKITREIEGGSDIRVCVSGVCAASDAEKTFVCGRVPFLMCGKGIEADETTTFNERISSQSNWIVDKGVELMGSFLK